MELAYYLKKKLENKVDDVVINFVEDNASQVKFVNNKIVKTGSEIVANIGIFLAYKKRIIFTNLKELSEKNIDLIVSRLLKFLKKVKPNKDYYGIAKGPFRYNDIDGNYDKRLTNLDHIDIIEKSINEASVKRCSGILENHEINNLLLSSNDIEVEDKSTGAYFSIRSFMNGDTSGYKTCCSRTLNNFKPLVAARESGKIARMALKPVDGKKGRYDVVFAPLAFSPIIENVGNSSSIFNIESGLSFLNGKLNKKICNLTLIDDPTLKNSFGSIKHDQEGRPTRRNIIIDKGVLKTYLYNTSMAHKYKVESTSNAGLIMPVPYNLILERGDYKFDELLPKRGLYITNVWYTRFNNYFTGDFSTIPRDGIFLIENNEIKNPVKNLRISENILNILKNVIAIGDKEEQVISWETEFPVTLPHVLIKDVNISKPNQ